MNVVDPRCKKGHRVRIDFSDAHLGWFCETCHVLLECDGPGWQWKVRVDPKTGKSLETDFTAP